MDTVRPRTIIRKSTDTLSRPRYLGASAPSEEDQVERAGFDSEKISRDGVDQGDKEAER